MKAFALVNLQRKKGWIKSINYVLIDVEGHEIEVLKGMDLEFLENRKRFPIIQVELGGTWVDERHTAWNWRQGDLARYFVTLGYKIYLIGFLPNRKGGKRKGRWLEGLPVLLPFHPNYFDDPWKLRGTKQKKWNWFAQGNLLAVNEEFLSKDLKPSLRQAIEEYSDVFGKEMYYSEV